MSVRQNKQDAWDADGRPGSGAHWLAVVDGGATARLACVRRTGPDGTTRPVVEWVDTVDWNEPAAALRRIGHRRRLSGLRRVVVLKPGGYQLIQVDAPDLPPAEWKDAIRWQLREQVGFPVEDAAIDLLEIPKAGAPRRQKALIVVAAPRAALAPLVDGAEDAGWPWSAISVSETALRNLSGLGDEPGHCQALLHLGDDQAIIVFTSGGELLHSRTIDVTLAQLAGPVGDARQLAFERASLALQRTLDGFERVNTSQPLSRMRVSPASAVADFLAFVAGLVELPIEPLDLASVLDLTAVAGVAADDRQLSPFLPAIGAALRS